MYPTWTQDLEVVCAGLDAAWKFFGGIPHRIVPDNMKTIVVSAHATSPRLNDAFRDHAEARNLFVDLARVRRPHQLDRLCKKYNAERVDALCKSALEFDVIDVGRLEGMLRKAIQVEKRVSTMGSCTSFPLDDSRATDVFETRKKGGV